jgi:hypothetical protein
MIITLYEDDLLLFSQPEIFICFVKLYSDVSNTEILLTPEALT